MRLLFTIFMIMLTLAQGVMALTDREKASRQFKFISKLYENKSYTEVLEEGEKLLKFSSDFPQADALYFILGESAYQMKSYDNARTYFNKVISGYPRSPFVQDSKYSMGWLYFVTGSYDQSIEYFKQITKKDLADEAAYKCGEAYYALGDYDNALIMLEKCIKKEDGKFFDKALYHSGICYLKKNDPANAKIVFDHIVRRNLDQSLVFYSRFQIAEIYYDEGNYAEAIALYKSVSAEKDIPERLHSDITYSLGWAYIKSGDFTSAINTFKTLQKSPEYADEALYRIIKCYYDLKEYDTVISLCGSAGENKFLPQIYYWQAFAYYKKDDYNNAEKVFEKIIQLNDDSVTDESMYMIATCKQKLGNYKDAIVWYEKLLATGDKADILYQIGECYFNLKDYAKSEETFNSLVLKYPEHEKADNALFEIGEGHYNQGQYSKAMEYYSRLASTFPKSDIIKDAIIRIGECHLAKNNIAEATKSFERLLEISEKQDPAMKTEILYRLGECYMKTELWDKALEIYKNIELSANSAYSREAGFKIGEIYYLKKDYEAAKKIFREIYDDSSNPLRYNAKFMTGEIYRENREYTKAIEQYRELTKYEFDGKEKIFFSAAWCYIQQKNYERAIKNYEYVISKYNQMPILAKARYWLAKTYEIKGDFALAAKEYMAVAVMYPEYKNSDYAMYNAGECYMKAGNKSSARKCLESVLKDFSSSQYVKNAQDLLNKL